MVHDPARDQLQLLWRIAGMAIMMSAEAAAGALLGWLVDRWAGTYPRWLTIGGAIGITVGLVSFVAAAWRLSRRQVVKNPHPQGPQHGTHHDPHH